MWETIERYQEFVVNGLDLLSFLFITPEVVHFARPLVQSKMGPVVFRAGLSIFIIYILMFICNSIGAHIAQNFSVSNTVIKLIRWFPFLVGAFAGFTFEFWGKRLASSGLMEKFFELFSVNLLYVGIMLFFVARMIAFAVASHRIFGIP
jgi:hypothetical protein